MSAEYPEPGAALFSRVAELTHHHPGVLFSLMYLIASLIGIMFSWSLYQNFNVPYFALAEISDFLLASIREPITFVLAAGAIPIVYASDRFSRATSRWANQQRGAFGFVRALYRLDRAIARVGLSTPIILVSYTFLFVTLYADWKAENIQAGQARFVQVELTTEAQVEAMPTEQPLILLGTTTRFIIFHDLDSSRSFVVPSESIAAMIVAGNRSTGQAEAKLPDQDSDQESSVNDDAEPQPAPDEESTVENEST